MKDRYEPTDILITVLTYPLPSRGYRELVCTAGVTEGGEWVRLYPIDYRYRPPRQRFRKYQWIRVGLLPYGSGKDRRKESRRPDVDSIEVLGPPLSTRDGWYDRRRVVDRLPIHTLRELHGLYGSERVSLGVVRPTRVLGLKVEPSAGEWKPDRQALFQQLRLFGPRQKQLRKIPFKFSYIFECEESDKPHKAMILDWELGALWLNEAARLGDEQLAAESVRHKFFDLMCSPNNDTRFFMGTVFPYNSWVVLGVFWPPKRFQARLF